MSKRKADPNLPAKKEEKEEGENRVKETRRVFCGWSSVSIQTAEVGFIFHMMDSKMLVFSLLCWLSFQSGEESGEDILLLSVSNSDQALALRVPGDILDLSGNDLDLNLQGVLLLGGIPDADVSEGVCSPEGRKVRTRD